MVTPCETPDAEGLPQRLYFTTKGRRSSNTLIVIFCALLTRIIGYPLVDTLELLLLGDQHFAPFATLGGTRRSLADPMAASPLASGPPCIAILRLRA